MSSEDFEQACKDAARGLRRLPAEVRKAIATRATDEVARPVAQAMAARFTGPWAVVLAAGTKARKQADPTIVVGGARRVVSGGASVRQLVYGNEWGGGARRTRVSRRTRGGGRSTSYTARTTQQFRQPHPAVIPTIRDESGTMLTAWADIVNDVIDSTIPEE